MIALIETRREQIAELCRRFRVERLELFGSAAKSTFEPESSDLDFIARFSGLTEPGIAKRYIGFAEALEDLFDRPVDVLVDQPFTNPYFAQAVAQTRQVIYERASQEAVV
jgi:hypothetical protein